MYRILLPAVVLMTAMSSGTSRGEENETYLLRYRLGDGERVDYEVTHVAKTKTRIRGAEEVSRVHTKSRRHWEVTSIGDDGTITFDHTLDSVAMTQQSGEAEEVRWDSEQGDDPPAPFKPVAEQIGAKLATLTIDPTGKTVDRKNHAGTDKSLGMGSLTIEFPEHPIPAGHSWSVAQETKVRTEAGEVKPVKIRQLYTLEQVKTGVATLRIRSEPLTPIHEESERAQVIQQLSDGTIRFDIDNGRMLSKQLDWDETVVGFQGANSLMEYNARFAEELIETPSRVAKRPVN